MGTLVQMMLTTRLLAFWNGPQRASGTPPPYTRGAKGAPVPTAHPEPTSWWVRCHACPAKPSLSHGGQAELQFCLVGWEAGVCSPLMGCRLPQHCGSSSLCLESFHIPTQPSTLPMMCAWRISSFPSPTSVPPGMEPSPQSCSQATSSSLQTPPSAMWLITQTQHDEHMPY